MIGICYLVATPIGNLKDISLRALETLREVDTIACEDTRHTRVLLNHYEIKKPLISYHKHNEREGADKIIKLLDGGKNVALVSDAGMPCISDPGAILVQELRAKHMEITVVPGANALTSAIALCGIEGNFTFIGFLSEKRRERDSLLKAFENTPTALVIYSSPHDLEKNLLYLYEMLGERKVHIVKEITKMFEKTISGVLGSIQVENTKGEFVVIVEASEKKAVELEDIDIKQELVDCLEIGMTKKEAIVAVCEKYNLNKNQVYPLSVGI